jgi:hypothetical protein
MKPYRLINLLVAFLFAAVAFANPPTVSANQSSLQTAGEITGEGQFNDGPGPCGKFSLTFDPAGGPVTGFLQGTCPIVDSGATIGEEVIQATLTGTFEGKDGGKVSGDVATGEVMVTYSVACDTCINGTKNISGSWGGTLNADGTGAGWILNQSITWNITYSAEDFQAGLGGNKRPTKTPGTAPTATPPAATPDFTLPGSSIKTTGQFCDNTNDFCGEISISFNPVGGPVTGTMHATHSVPAGDHQEILDVNGTLDGTFTGGDGGQLIGTITYGVWEWTCPSCNFVLATPASLSGYPWGGSLHANGTGDGTLYPGTTWSVTFSAADFQAGLATPAPTETSQNSLQHQIGGISAEMGDKIWSDHELQLLNEVLTQFPPDLLNKLALKSILRFSAYTDDGKSDPNTFGVYSLSSGTIRIFDRAKKPFDFSNDNGDTEFKATILHEMTHALQYYKDDQSKYNNPAGQNPLVRDYINISGAGQDGWTYSYTGGWTYQPVNGNDPPTNYGMTNPLEDMSESVMMYVYEPQKLQNSSPQRYTYIRDRIYGGVEYANGKPKGK